MKNKSCNVSRLLYQTLNPGNYKGLVIRHKCDNRACCNIEHLEVGTQRDNILDIKKRNRGLFGGESKIPRGEKAGRAKLTEQQVLEIRSRYPEEDSIKLSKIYKVNMTTILAIIHRRSWKHI